MSNAITKISLAVVGVILGWVMVVPSFEFPDEQAHLGTVSYLVSTGAMPSYDKQDLTLEMGEAQKLLGIFRDGNGQNRYTYHPEYHVEYSGSGIGLYESQIHGLNTPENRTTYVGSEAAKYPPLYYHYSGLFMGLVNSNNLFTRLYASRLCGLLLAFLMAYTTYQIGRLIFAKKIYATTLTLMVMTQPMMSFVTAGVNSDNLHNLLFTLIIYFSLRLLKYNLRLIDLLSVMVLVALNIYTKPQGFIAIPLVVVVLLLTVIKSRKWKLLVWVAIITVLTLLVGSSELTKYYHLLMADNAYGTTFIEYLRFSANKLVAQNVVWYWGVFKWLGVVLPPIYWRVANRVVLLSAVGLVVYLWRVIKKKKSGIDPLVTFYLLLATLLYALAIFWYDWQHTKLNGYSLGIQARYFFPTIVAHMALLLVGFTSLGWTVRVRMYLRRFLVILFAWLQLGAMWRVISIYYDTSSLSQFILQASQYKPEFAKGEWWYLWIAIYLLSIIYLVYLSLNYSYKKVKPKLKHSV